MANPEKNGVRSQLDTACGSSCGVQKDGTPNKTYFSGLDHSKNTCGFQDIRKGPRSGFIYPCGCHEIRITLRRKSVGDNMDRIKEEAFITDVKNWPDFP